MSHSIATRAEVIGPPADVTVPAPGPERKPYLVIEPVRGWRSLRLGDLWEFRGLLSTLGCGTSSSSTRADMPSGAIPYFVFALAGMFGRTLFNTTHSTSPDRLTDFRRMEVTFADVVYI